MSDSLLKPTKGDEFSAPLLAEVEDKTESIMTIGSIFRSRVW